jgi:hypothetical protein
LASSTTIAVISLVIDAIGRTALGFFSKQDRAGSLVLHQHCSRLQREIVRIVQRCLALRRLRTHLVFGLQLHRYPGNLLLGGDALLFLAGLGLRRRSTGADHCGSQQHN